MAPYSVSIDVPNNHNPNAVIFAGRHYDTIRPKQVRSHNRVYHEYGSEVPPLHIPVDLEGVVP